MGGCFLAAEAADDTVLTQVILFGRHGVRTPNLPNSSLNNFSSQKYPVFPDVPGGPSIDNQPSILTNNGAANETWLGSYYRQWLIQEGLLSGRDSKDAAYVYVRAMGTPLIAGTAQAFAAGLLPAAKLNVDTYTPATLDPLFNPVAAGVATLDETMAVAAVNGRLGGNPQALATAYAAEFALTRAVLFGYPVGENPAPPTPPTKMDVTAMPVTATAGNVLLPVNLGGLANTAYAIDPFVMEYEDGLPASEVAWGQLDAAGISQVFRLYDKVIDLEYRTPYLAAVQSSNMASHIVRTMMQSANGHPMDGALGTPSNTVVVVIGSNTNIAGVAALFNLDWLVAGYQPDVSAPGGILMFELRQSLDTGEFLVRTSYVTQTMDQLRSQAHLSLATPPAAVPVFVPGCSTDNATFDCSLRDFVQMAERAIDARSIEPIHRPWPYLEFAPVSPRD